MKHSRELLVGITIIIAVILFAAGIRYFQDLPFFGGGYTLQTSFADAQGLVSGSPVRINGVTAGTVRRVELRTQQDDVFVEFEMHGNVTVPQGSWVRVSGMEMMGNVQLEMVLGPGSAPPLAPDATVPGVPREGIGDVLDRAPTIAARADTVLAASLATIEDLRLIAHTQSAVLEETMNSMRTAASGFNRVLAANEASVAGLIANSEALSGDLSRFTAANADSLTMALQQFNSVLRALDLRLTELQQTTAGIDALVEGVRRGDGTLGLLANDPMLYHRLDSTLTSLNHLLVSLERNPGRFMRELRLIDLF